MCEQCIYNYRCLCFYKNLIDFLYWVVLYQEFYYSGVRSGITMTDTEPAVEVRPAGVRPTLAAVRVSARPPAKFVSTTDFTLWIQRFELYLAEAEIPADKRA